MDMQQAWEDVEKMLQQVRPHLLRAGIPERQLSMPEAEPAEIRIERYLEIFDWLTALIASDEWTALMKVWKLRPERIWADYILHEIKGLQEQILLETAQAGIRKRWKLERPFFFGRKFKKGNHGDESSSDPESTGETAAEQDGHPESASSGGVRSAGERAAARDRRRRRSGVLRPTGERVPGNGGGQPRNRRPGQGSQRPAKRPQSDRPGTGE